MAVLFSVSISNIFVTHKSTGLSMLLDVLLGVGIGSLAAIALRGGSYKVKLTTQLTVAIASLLFSLVASILLVILLKFTAHRLLGVLLVTSYIVFFVVLMAVEFS
jgi:Ca2+/Na+ antiporter